MVCGANKQYTAITLLRIMLIITEKKEPDTTFSQNVRCSPVLLTLTECWCTQNNLNATIASEVLAVHFYPFQNYLLCSLDN